MAEVDDENDEELCEHCSCLSEAYDCCYCGCSLEEEWQESS